VSAVYLILNFLASPSNTSRSPVMSRISKTVRTPSTFDCGMPATSVWPLSSVLHTVGKSFPLRTNWVHRCARSLLALWTLGDVSAAGSTGTLIQIKAALEFL
jgi:hypothetical protein